MYSNYTNNHSKNQILRDEYQVGSKTKQRKWKEKKLASLELSSAYWDIGKRKKAARVRDCGNFLEFKRFELAEIGLRLHVANFCKDRLCPMCAWRRSMKIYAQVSEIMRAIEENEDKRFIFLTLTQKNISDDTGGKKLKSELKRMSEAFAKLRRRAEVAKVTQGYFKALEITWNGDTSSKNYDTYHPHYHIVISLNKSYFNSRDYIKHERWVELWQESMQLDYKPNVDVRTLKNKTKKQLRKSVAEIAKYSVKATDFLINDELKKLELVETFDNAMRYKRLIAFGGLFKKWHQKLNLDDQEDGNLVQTGAEEDALIHDGLAYIVERYNWNIGLKNYVLSEIRTQEEEEGPKK